MVRGIAYKLQQALALIDIKMALPYILTALWLTGYVLVRSMASFFNGVVSDVLLTISSTMKIYMIYVPVNFIKETLNLNNTIAYMVFVIVLTIIFKILSYRMPASLLKSKTVKLLLLASAVWAFLFIRVF